METRRQWVKPVLLEKKLSETKAGTGLQNDGQWEMQS